MTAAAVHRCARCSIEYVTDPPPSCGRCAGPLYRLPDRWAGQDLDHRPRTPRLLSAMAIRGHRSVRRPAGEVLAPIFGSSIPSAWLLVVTGLPGAGKSTWVLRALDSGAWQTPVLVAAEEGVEGAGLAERVARLEVMRVQFSDARSLPELTSVLQEHEPDVLAIDSATSIGLEPGDLLMLRRLFPATTLVAVVQSIKNGAHRGSQAWLHDADAVLRIDGPDRWALTKCWFSPTRTSEEV